MSTREQTYFELLKLGKATPDDFCKYVDFWHAGRGGSRELNEYLGITDEMMSKIVVTGGKILDQLYNTERGRRVASEDNKLKS